MANEITVSGRLSVTKDNLNQSRNVQLFRDDMAGDAYSSGTQSIPTTAGGTAVTISAAVSTNGWALFKNLNATNFIELGVVVSGTFYPSIKIKPGKTAGPLQLAAGVTLYARSDTGACLLDHFIVEA